MIEVVLQAGILIGLGVLWQWLRPQGLDGDTLRRSLTTLVYYLLLPALVLEVLWQAPIGLDSVKVTVMALIGLLTGFGLAFFWFKLFPVERPAMGAILLAATFPNVTYLGLPVLETALGPWARSIAIQYDLFACTPVLLTVGMLVAARYGSSQETHHPIKALLRIPPLWAAIIAVVLNLATIPAPTLILELAEMLGNGVVPLMLFSIGLGLRWSREWYRQIPQIAPIAVIQLLLIPAVVWWASGWVAMSGDVRTGVILEAAMPTMVLGIVLCDRYGLKTDLYAMAVTVTTALSLVTLPLWFEWSVLP